MSDLFTDVFSNLYLVWWVVIPLVGLTIFKDFWVTRLIENYIKGIEWVTFEISIPKENIKSIRSMEQVFVSLHGTYSFGIRKGDRYLKGLVEDWMSLEIVGFARSIHFYIRARKKYRNLIEAAIFAQYPDTEIIEVDDHTKLLPANLPNAQYDIFGTDYNLAREDAYPLRTYIDFEEISRAERVEERKIDPIATISEVMSNLKENELIWLQLLIRPTGDAWIDNAKDVIDKLMGKEVKKKKGVIGTVFGGVGEFLQNFVAAPAVHPEWSGKGVGEETKSETRTTPGDQNVLRAVQNKLSKPAFESILRFIYIDDRNEFTADNVSAVGGALRQFGMPNLNSLKPNFGTITIPALTSKLPFRREKLIAIRKKQMYRAYIEREMPQGVSQAHKLKLKTSILNTEELATLFHPPTVSVKAPKLQPVESRRGGPPVDLPIRES